MGILLLGLGLGLGFVLGLGLGVWKTSDFRSIPDSPPEPRRALKHVRVRVRVRAGVGVRVSEPCLGPYPNIPYRPSGSAK